MEKFYDKFNNLFSVSKTLRFELEPIGKTKKFFEKYILKEDERKSDLFKKVKKYCDEYHKLFISECLKNFDDKDFENLLKEYFALVNLPNPSEKETKRITDILKVLRAKISDRFTKNPKYKGLFGKELINDYLKDYYKDNKNILDEITPFKDFTSYFTGFNTNRKNMYSKEEKHTAIAYRLIDENLSTYIKNIKAFNIILENIPDIKIQIKENLNLDCDEFFSNIENYTNVLTQEQIETYNLAISGKSQENSKIKGINEIVNLYKQKNKIKIPKLRELYKQLLSDTTSASFKFDIIEYDYQIVEMINSYYETFKKNFIDDNGCQSALSNIQNYDIKNIYINNDVSLTSLSQNIYNDWNYINSLLGNEYDQNYKGKAKFGTEKYSEKKEETLKKIKEISLFKVEELIKNYDKENNNSEKIFEYFKNAIKEKLEKINIEYNNTKIILEREYEQTSTDLLKDEQSIEKIKNFLDSIKDLQILIKYLIPKNNTLETDLEFYNALNYDILSEIIPVYNKTRNYLTKKPYSLEKFKLNFDCPTFLNGWDLNKEEANLGTLFRKDGNYYIGIMNTNSRKSFIEYNQAEFKNEKKYQKIEYKLLPGPNKMLPKVFFSESRIKEFNPSEELLSKYERGYHKKGADFDLNFCHQLIDFFKASINKHEDWSKFNFKFSETNTYNDISEFYKEVELQGYKISFTDISEEYINKLVEEGKLYLFRIYNKDFSSYSKGTPNLHTLYWKALFDEDNLKNIIYKLNGGAEIFYRKKSIEAKITHPKNQPIDNKNPNNPKKQSIFEYDLIKDKRFTLDKFQFHVPITLNFKAKDTHKLNDLVNNKIKNTEDINIIGIDRGERHLLYACVINKNGEILEQYSLNTIGQTNYHYLLSKKEDDRLKQRQAWGTIQNIKELKEGYMSQVIHKLTKLMVQYNAVIVLEDLNSGFKNSRKKVEKSVYDKFETALINKLSYLVDKSIQNKFEQGGIMNAYQLANADIKSAKQNGVIFYIPAWCTSKIDPTTGFVNLFDLKKIDKEFVKKFNSIKFNNTENYFEFDFDYSNFSDKSSGIRQNWTLCSFGNRIRTFKNPKKNNNYDSQTVELTQEFKKLFDSYNMDCSNLKDEILDKSDSKFFNATPEKNNFYGFALLFKLLLQLRNSITGSEEDYILSPIKNKKGLFYDSRTANGVLPENADANGAYNIARKGLLILNRIKNSEENTKTDYTIKNADWLTYVQQQDR